MLLSIILCIGFDTYFSLNKMHSQTEQSFYKPENTAIQTQLDNKASSANKISNLAKKYYQTTELIISDVVNAANELANADTISKKYEINNSLNRAVDALYYAMNNNSDVNRGDLTTLSSLYNEYNSYNDAILKSGYNQSADEYNAILSRFPANIVQKITNLKSAEVFK